MTTWTISVSWVQQQGPWLQMRLSLFPWPVWLPNPPEQTSPHVLTCLSFFPFLINYWGLETTLQQLFPILHLLPYTQMNSFIHLPIRSLHWHIERFGRSFEDKEELIYSFKKIKYLLQDENGTGPGPSTGHRTVNKTVWSYSCGVHLLGRRQILNK